MACNKSFSINGCLLQIKTGERSWMLNLKNISWKSDDGVVYTLSDGLNAVSLNLQEHGLNEQVLIAAFQECASFSNCCPTVLQSDICVDGVAVNVHYAIDPVSADILWIKGLDGTNYDPQVYTIKGCSDCPFGEIEAEIFQTGANTIDNIDINTSVIPAPNVTIATTDCLRLTLQFKDPITGANVGAAKVYTTNVDTPFTAADVADWEVTFGIFGGIQNWIGADWSLTGWSKNTPQGAFLLPNPSLAYDIEFSVQIAKDCGTQVVTNVSSVLALARETAIADNGTSFLSPTPYTSNVTPMFTIGGIRLVQPINHPMVVYAPQGACANQPLIGLAGIAPGITIHNDGNWAITQIEKVAGGIMTGSHPLAAGVDFRTAIVQTISTMIGDPTLTNSVPVIQVDYPVLEYVECVDGVVRLLTINNTRPSDTVRVITLQNTNGLLIELEFKVFKTR